MNDYLIPSEQPDVNVEGDEAEFLLQPYLIEPRSLSSCSDKDSSDESSNPDSSSGAGSRLNGLFRLVSF